MESLKKLLKDTLRCVTISLVEKSGKAACQTMELSFYIAKGSLGFSDLRKSEKRRCFYV